LALRRGENDDPVAVGAEGRMCGQASSYMSTPIRVGIIGAGYISAAYLKAAKNFPELAIVSCADAQQTNAQKRGEEFGLKVQSVDELLQDKAVDLILNLTTPQSHVQVTSQGLEAGKHVYSEKPLALNLAEAEALLKNARRYNVRLGCAPDTFLGGGQQTARKLIDDGVIGKPLGGTAFVLTPGPESWHPNPQFYYQTGGGPVFDMGPYYLTALINLLGPVTRVTSIAGRGFAERIFGAGPRKGEKFTVEIPTHFNALLEFEQGAIISFHASFDVQGHSHLPIEIYGTEGSLQIPDPNYFGGRVRLLRRGGLWADMPLTHGYDDRNYRILGVAEMAAAIRRNRPHRASDQIALHTVEVMEAIVIGGSSGKAVSINSHCERPRALEPLPRLGTLD
jgi:predicted dehydrogenase